MEEIRHRNLIASFSIITGVISVVTLIIAYIEFNFVNRTSWEILAVAITMVIITLGLGAFQIFDKLRELKTQRAQKQTGPLRINLEIAGEPITIDAPDVQRVEEILKVVQSLHDTNPSIIEVKSDVATTEVHEKSEVEER